MPDHQRSATLVLDSRTHMHALVRMVTPDEVCGPVGPASVELVNDLMMAVRPNALLEAVDAIGPFWRGDELAVRLMGADEVCGMMGDGALVAPDAPLLIEECKVDPLWRLDGSGAFVQGLRKPRQDAGRAIARFGFGGAASPVDVAPGDCASYVLEPLQDWLLARALVSVAMRLAATQRCLALAGGGDDILTLARFHEAKDTALGFPFSDGGAGTWVTPLLNHCKILHGAHSDGGASDASRFELQPLGTTTRGAGKDGVCILSAEGGTGESGPKPSGVRRLYLALVGVDQRTLANAYVSVLDGLLGTRQVTLDGYEASVMPVRHPNVACSLWAAFLAHESRYLMSCKHCGRTVFSTRQGPGREFCSDVCRANFHSEERRRKAALASTRQA